MVSETQVVFYNYLGKDGITFTHAISKAHTLADMEFIKKCLPHVACN